MAVLHIFNWDHAATLVGAREITERTYPFNNIDNHTEEIPGRFGGVRGLSLQNSGFVQFNVPSTDEVFIGFAHKRFADNNGIRFIELREGTTFHGSLQTAFNGGFRYTRSTSTQVALSETRIPLDTWVYCELRVKIGDGTAGNVTLKVAGTEVFNVDTDTRNGGSLGEIDNIRILSNNALQRISFDDVYVCDAEGTINNTFLGPIQVLTFSPNGDDTTDFTATGTGTTHADRVADANADDDTAYVESSTTDDQDIWDYEDIDTGFTIRGIEIDTDVRETDASDFTLETIVKSGATTDGDTAQPIAGTDWEIQRRVVEVDPNTSEQWTAGNFNAAKFGVEVG